MHGSPSFEKYALRTPKGFRPIPETVPKKLVARQTGPVSINDNPPKPMPAWPAAALTGSARPEHTSKPKRARKPQRPRISILFDGDNVSSKVIPALIESAKQHGDIVHFRIFLRAGLLSCSAWQEVLAQFPIQAVCPQGRMRKNDTDQCMELAAKEIIKRKSSKKIDVVCLVSNDHYFAKVMQDAKAAGKTVWGVGSLGHISQKVKAQCHKLLYVEQLLRAA